VHKGLPKRLIPGAIAEEKMYPLTLHKFC